MPFLSKSGYALVLVVLLRLSWDIRVNWDCQCNNYAQP